jgi:hypothetical protein
MGTMAPCPTPSEASNTTELPKYQPAGGAAPASTGIHIKRGSCCQHEERSASQGSEGDPMGHIRLGRLPRTRGWIAVFDVLEAGDGDAAALARAVASAATCDLEALQRAPGAVGDGFWILAVLGEGGNADELASRLTELGWRDTDVSTPAALVSGLPPQKCYPGVAAVFCEMADLSLRSALSRHLVSGTLSLFGTARDDVAASCRDLGRPAVFAQIARDYLAEFMSRVVRYSVDRESSNFMSTSHAWSTSGDLLELGDRLDAYCRESSLLVRDFAEGWYSKARYQSDEGVTRDATRGFAAHALTKLRQDMEGCADE